MLLWWAVLGCGTDDEVLKAYEDTKKSVMTDVLEVPERWHPDLRLLLSAPLTQTMIEQALTEVPALSRPFTFPGGTATPTLQVASVSIRASESRCRPQEPCLPLAIAIDGQLLWTSPLGNGSIPVKATMDLDLATQVERDGGTWVVRAKPKDIRNVSATLAGLNPVVARGVEGPLRTQIQQAVERLPLMEVTRWDGEVPIKAMRLSTDRGGLIVEMSTSLPVQAAIPRERSLPRQGFTVWIANPTLTMFARRAAFEHGPAALDVVADPTRIALDEQSFELDLRLWGTKAGWTHDVTAKGRIEIAQDEVRLVASEVKNVGTSASIAGVEPSAYLLTGVLPTVMHRAMNLALPNVAATTRGLTTATTRISSVSGLAGSTRIIGTVDLKTRPKPSMRPSRP